MTGSCDALKSHRTQRSALAAWPRGEVISRVAGIRIAWEQGREESLLMPERYSDKLRKLRTE